MQKHSFKAVIFDMDDTLITSHLDFSAIRNDLGVTDDIYILEHIKNMKDPLEQAQATATVENHEYEAAQLATLKPGVTEVMTALETAGVKKSLFTRNSRVATDRVLKNFQLKFDQVITRSCAPAKPDPTGLLSIVKNWDLDVSEVLYVGDFIFDLEAGKNAGIATALYIPGKKPDFAQEADFLFTHYDEFLNLFSFESTL